MTAEVSTTKEACEKIDDLIDQLDAPIFKTSEEIEAVITLVSSRLNDKKRPLLENDRALLGKIMEWVDHSFVEFIHSADNPPISRNGNT